MAKEKVREANLNLSEQPSKIEKKIQTRNYTAADVVTGGLLDKDGGLWFSTSRHGIYHYDGVSFHNFTEEDGLCNN